VEALLTDRFVQMTGLDIAKDHLIEIAVLITNGDLEIVAKVSAGRRMCSKLDLVLMLMIIGSRTRHPSAAQCHG
jgi:oligoribonuclease (3'-5' exoribonuclease)